MLPWFPTRLAKIGKEGVMFWLMLLLLGLTCGIAVIAIRDRPRKRRNLLECRTRTTGGSWRVRDVVD
jgi:hypothetical protein